MPRPQVADELESVAKEFEALEAEFKRLWLAEDREGAGYEELVKRFAYTIAPCREKAGALRAAGLPAPAPALDPTDPSRPASR